MDELTAAAAVMAMSVDDFGEEDLEQYALHSAATIDEAQPPAAEAANVDSENDEGSTASGGPGIAHPKVTNDPRMPLCTPARPPLTRPEGHARVSC